MNFNIPIGLKDEEMQPIPRIGPHMHAEAIKAWADGHPVQFRTKFGEAWLDVTGDPIWRTDFAYRIKPTEDDELTVFAHVNYSNDTVHIIREWSPNVRFKFDRYGLLIAVKKMNGW